MRLLHWVAILALGLPAAARPADDAAWVVAFEDAFDRPEIGADWEVLSGEAVISGGRLLLRGAGATLLCTRPFAADVTLEFEAEADPSMPPCDLSAGLAAPRDYGWGYLIAFGGQSNRVNQILGPGVRVVDEKPPFVIEHGRRYLISARKEGRVLSLTVDGRELLRAETHDPLVGPGFNRVALITWTGMLVDRVRVLERAVPAPETPRVPDRLSRVPFYRDGRTLCVAEDFAEQGLDDAVRAYNERRLDDALRMFGDLEDQLLSLWGRAFVLGDLAFTESDRGGELRDLARAFRAYAASHPAEAALQDAAMVAGWFGELRMSREASVFARRLVALGPGDWSEGAANPFYHKALLYDARYRYWEGLEVGDRNRIETALATMDRLRETWPDVSVLRQYAGEAVPWGEDLNADVDRHPAWAAYLREAYGRQVRIMEAWFEMRQQPDGQLGGGWGDDVELMRTWLPIAAISTGAGAVREGIERFAEGIWQTLEDGYDPTIGDVEHSAEPSADIVPGMLLLRYGDPLWVERNRLSCRTIRDRFMGIDAKGHPRFKSTEFGSRGVKTDLRAGADTGYHARAMKHFLWQAWWGDPDARDWFLRWVEGWRQATMARIGSKPAGLPPPGIWYPSGDIVPPVPGVSWWDPHYNYYGAPGLPGMIFDCFLAAYALGGDEEFLRAFQFATDEGTRGPLPRGEVHPPSPEWCHLALTHAVEASRTALYKLLTGERTYDEYTLRHAEPAQIYRTNYDLERYQKSFESAAKSLRTKFELRTTEVLATDRAALDSALTVFGAYTGAVQLLRDANTPTFAVTYQTEGTDFAALVVESTPRRVRVWLYSFTDAPQKVGLRFWRLEPGIFRLLQGEMLPGERPGQNRYAWLPAARVSLLRRAEGVDVTVPPGKVWVVDLLLVEPRAVPARSPDLAAGERSVSVRGAQVTVRVHNLGNAAAGPFTVALQERDGVGWKTVAYRRLDGLKAPEDLRPTSTVIRFHLARPPADGSRVVMDPRDELFELCETNNSVIVSDAGR